MSLENIIANHGTFGRQNSRVSSCSFRRCSFSDLGIEAKNVSHCLARQDALNRKPVDRLSLTANL